MKTLKTIARFFKESTFDVDQTKRTKYFQLMLSACEFDELMVLGTFYTKEDAIKAAKIMRVLIGAMNNPYLTMFVVAIDAEDDQIGVKVAEKKGEKHEYLGSAEDAESTIKEFEVWLDQLKKPKGAKR